jgi:hypothetical protein
MKRAVGGARFRSELANVCREELAYYVSFNRLFTTAFVRNVSIATTRGCSVHKIGQVMPSGRPRALVTQGYLILRLMISTSSASAGDLF